mgnify:CR=1 FL=1
MTAVGVSEESSVTVNADKILLGLAKDRATLNAARSRPAIDYAQATVTRTRMKQVQDEGLVTRH